MANRKKKDGADRRLNPDYRSESDLANQRMGKNRLQGNDQASVHNQRLSVPGTKDEADQGVRDSFEKLDKDVRAERELGKGRRKA
jgi:hypothetical protein